MHNNAFLRRHCLLTFIAIATIGPGIAHAKLPRVIKVGSHEIVLNGEGSRSKSFISIYESGLYLVSPSSNASAILDAEQLMAIRIRITSSFVSRSSLVSSLEEGLKKSTGGNTSKITNETQAFMNCLKDEVKKNDLYDFLYVPNKGMYIVKNGKIQGTIPGLAFKKAFFGIWLSDQPVDKKLRTALLTAKPVNR